MALLNQLGSTLLALLEMSFLIENSLFQFDESELGLVQGFLLLVQTIRSLTDLIFILSKTLSEFPLPLVIESSAVLGSLNRIFLIREPLPQTGKFGIQCLGQIPGFHDRSFALRHICLDRATLSLKRSQ